MLLENMKDQEIVISWLKSHGYYKVVSGGNDRIEADGKLRKMIVAIGTLETIDNELIQNLKSCASNKHREAWLAAVEPEDNEVIWSMVK